MQIWFERRVQKHPQHILLLQFEDSQIEYNKDFPLGEGNFGIVYKGVRTKSDGDWEQVSPPAPLPTLKGQSHEIFCFCFFHESVFPPAPEYPLRPFRFFSKIRRNICNSRCTTGINDTGGQFATGVVYTGGRQWEQLSNCWQLKMNLKKSLSIC